MAPMKPLTKRLLNVLAGLLNTIAVLASLFTALQIGGYALLFAKGGSDAVVEIIARLSAGILPLILVATINYLVFGRFRVWNRILISSAQSE